MSEQPSVVECLSTAMETIRAVGKTGRNTQQNYDFRGIDAVVNAASPAFRHVGVVVTPELRSIDYETVEVGSKRSLMQSCKVVVAYTFHGPAGDTVCAVAPGEAMDSGDKATAKAMSVAFRTALLQSLCIPTTDADPDEQSYERSPRSEAPTRPAGAITVAEAKGQLVEHLATTAGERLGSELNAHAKAIWEQAEVAVDGKWVARSELDVLRSVAGQYLADLAAMQPEAAS